MDESDAPKYPPVEPFSSPTIDPTPQQDEPRQERDLSRYSLTAEEASELFIHAGVPRSLRTVIRYCSNKTLDCTKVDTERSLKYLVAKESVDNRIVELQQIAALGYGTPHLEATRHGETIDEPRPAMASHDATPDADQKIHELTGRVGELERENERLEREKMNLEITNRVKDAVAPQLTVVTSTIARSGFAVLVKDAHAASVVPSEAAGHETTATRVSSSNGL